MPTVLITRPEPYAHATAERLRCMGYDCLIAPMLHIHAANTPFPIGHYDCIMVTSQNALAALQKPPAALHNLMQMPCYCVGIVTAAAARSYGFTKVYFTEGSGEDLARLITKQHTTPQAILHISGKDISTSPHDILRKATHDLTVWPIYKAELAPTLPDTVINQLRSASVDAILFYSTRTATHFLDLLEATDLTPTTQSLRAVCLSHAIVNKIARLPWRGLTAAIQPSEDGLIAELLQHLPVEPD